MPKTLDEILADLKDGNVTVDGEAADTDALVTALTNTSHPIIKALRSAQFSSGKKEGGKAGKVDATKLKELQDKVAELETALEEAKSEAPEAVKKAEADLAKERAKVAALEGKLTEKTAKLLDGHKTVAKAKFVDALVEAGVHRAYAKEVLAAQYADRFEVDEAEGLKGVKKPGEESSYEGKSPDEQVKLLARDVRKTVKETIFLTSNADRGGGTGRDSGAPGGGPADKKPTEKIAEEKAATGDYRF